MYFILLNLQQENKCARKGDDFSKVIDLCVIYISEFDIFGDGLTAYHIDKVVRENGRVVDDGFNEIFVNTAIDDGTDIADLMRCFLQRTVNNPKFPKLSRSVSILKNTEGGRRTVCEAMKEIVEREVKEEKLAIIRELLKDKKDNDYIIRITRCTLEDIEKTKA